MSVVAVIGLGNMGAPMSARLVDAGHEVRGFDPADAARIAAARHGVQVRTSAEDAVAAADAVILMLPNSDVVDAVVGGLLDADAFAPGALVIDMSSSDPLRTRALAATVETTGRALVDAPVSGGVRGAQNGALTIMVGGADDDIARATPILAVLGRVVPSGGVGAGHAVKALNNLLSATHLWVTSEAIEAGRRFGLDPAVMLDVFNGSSGRSGSTENKWPNFILPGSYDSGFGLRLMLKDMKIATSLAAALDAPSALGADAVDLWQAAADDLPADADHTRVAEWIAARTSEA
ncbi:NAD(P)-dependent oxidoreductase [Microbacterium sp. NPDC089695]|uniref:NAD(P)-dependent oxidoreductase n=1 Tax=Microbacterium sp. NPDC089695 TaxID=3364198 RepID=UPI00381892A5